MDPESYVAFGPGTGSAGIFGNPGNAFDTVRRLADRDFASHEREKEFKRRLEINQKAQRDKDFNALFNISPELTYSKFNDQIKNNFQENVIDYVAESKRKGISASDPGFRAEYRKRVNDSRVESAKAAQIKSEITEAKNWVGENSDHYDEGYYTTVIYDAISNPDGSPKDLKDVDTAKIIDTLKNDPRGFNAHNYAKDFVGDLGNLVIQDTIKRAKAGGYYYEDMEMDLKAGLYQMEDGKPVMDPVTGRPKINITPEVVDSFLSNPTAKAWVDQKVNQNKGLSAIMNAPFIGSGVDAEKMFGSTTQKAVITDLLRNFEEYKESVALSGTGTSRGRSGDLLDKYKSYDLRLREINNIQNAFVGPDGVLTKEPSASAVKSAGAIKNNARFAGMPIADAQLVSRYDKRSEIMGLPYSPDSDDTDYLVFKVKEGSGSRTRYRLQKVPLGQSGTGAELNTIFETSSTKGPSSRAIGWADLDQYNRDLNIPVYNLREGLANTALEIDPGKLEASFNRLEKNVNLEDAKKLIGGTYNGKRIVNVDLANTGVFNWNPTRIKMTLRGPDQNDEVITLNNSNIAILREVLQQNPSVINSFGTQPTPKGEKKEFKPKGGWGKD